MKVYAKAGQQISLNLLAIDPDKHAVALSAWPYKEAGNGAADIQISGNKAMVKIPNTAKAGETYHVIIEGKDNGTPALTGYRRVVVNIL